jgi:hypothetical protein
MITSDTNWRFSLGEESAVTAAKMTLTEKNMYLTSDQQSSTFGNTVQPRLTCSFALEQKVGNKV